MNEAKLGTLCNREHYCGYQVHHIKDTGPAIRSVLYRFYMTLAAYGWFIFLILTRTSREGP